MKVKQKRSLKEYLRWLQRKIILEYFPFVQSFKLNGQWKSFSFWRPSWDISIWKVFTRFYKFPFVLKIVTIYSMLPCFTRKSFLISNIHLVFWLLWTFEDSFLWVREDCLGTTIENYRRFDSVHPVRARGLQQREAIRVDHTWITNHYISTTHHQSHACKRSKGSSSGLILDLGV